MRMVLFKEALHFIVAELVACFKPAVLFAVLLDCVICEMDILVAQIAHCVEETARANIAILVEVALQSSIDWR